ncbi:hypothetical protein GCM10009798_04200 [Nocardioides panacihumi]|uniref:Uncharacterized protein n=1 Tax=Nocardioides panacihumi TaxID=400774 RepID=A0ABN2QDE3_9ACTN
MANERVEMLAEQAAALLPGPPAVHDAFGYLAWEDLILSAVRRLQSLADDVPALAAAGARLPSLQLDGTGLLVLAARLANDDAADTATCAILRRIAIVQPAVVGR